MCALFYDYRVQTPSSLRQVCSAWGEQDAVLAVGLENREVHFFTDEGERVQGCEAYTRQADIVSMAWQPRGGALAVGWSDGMVSLWVFKEKTAREVNSPHTARVGLLRWAPSGNRLLTADENGMFAVWKVDSRGQLSLSAQYARQGSITHCVFATRPVSRDKAARSDSFSQHACPQFFFGGEIGSVHYADDLGHITDVQVLNHAIDAMMFYEERNQLIVITRGLQLIVFQVGATDGTVRVSFKVKLSVASDGCLHETRWTGPGMLAIASGEPLVRFWDLQREENSVLSLPKVGGSAGCNVSAIDFSPRRRILAAGTAQGLVCFWRSTPVTDASKPGAPPSYRWDFLFSASVAQTVLRVGWNSQLPTLYANTTEGVVILHEGSMQRSLCADLAVIQTRPTDLSVERFRDGTVTQATLEAGVRIKGVSHDGSGLVVWGGTKAEVYELRDGEPRRVSQFKCASSAMVLRGDFLYRTSGNHVEICNVQGVVKNSVSFTEAEGRPCLLSLQSKFLAVATDKGLLRVFDLSRRDPKAVGSMGNFRESFGDETKGATIRSISVNADGTRVCVLADKREGALKIRVPQSKLFLFQADLNVYQQYDFGSASYPISVFFDPVEPRLLACETAKTGRDSGSREAPSRRDAASEEPNASASASQRGSGPSGREVTIFFASNDHGLMMQDSFELELKYQALLGIQVPRVYFVAQVDTAAKEETTTVVHVGGGKGTAAAAAAPKASGSDTVSYLRTKIMRDFVGLDKVNDAARQALIDFCYYMTIGSMDEAYRSVKLIENPSVWENMAKMCVKTKRLDVAEVCLGNMGHARGAAAVQEAKAEPEPQVAIAMVAVQLGLLDDAARLYRECGRYDLLNRLYQASGFWQKAVDVAAKRDRIHLKTTYHSLGAYYEDIGDVKAAMEAYEDAGTHQKDIPRMLFKLGKLELLQKYVATSSDRELITWWAQYEESLGHLDLAIESYEKAKDYLSVVRVLCFKKDLHAAAKVVKASGSRAAAYHLARQFEALEDVPSAIHFFACGGSYNHAIRLAKEHALDTELMSYALMGTPSDMLDCAAYFEARGEMEKAVQLFHKGGHVAKALELCFQAQLFDELHHLTDELGPSNTSPATLHKCAAFFTENGHYAKAVHLLLVGGRVGEALDVCMAHDVKVTEEMAERMTPPKEDGAAGDKARRAELLRKLAKCCKRQGAFHLATKKYTQAGDKLKAMKCLLKSGDTEKVIFFANVSRNSDIFVLAANYLQNLDWRADADVLKHIVGFYAKARAFEQLAAFYSNCAQAEVEEFRDYDKAVGALREAVKVLAKARPDARERLTKAFEARIELMEQFMDCRRQMRESPREAGEALMKLLEAPGIDEAVRVGDALAMLAEAHFDAGDLRRSAEVLDEMRRRGVSPKTYVSARVLQEVQAGAGPREGGAAPRSERKDAGGDDERHASRPSSREAKGRARDAGMASARGKAGAGGRDDDDDDDEMEEDIAEED